MKTNKKGISLIVLVITIIVMIILATAIILSLNSSNISGKASEAKLSSDLANKKEAASVFLAEYELKVAKGKIDRNSISANDYVKAQLEAQGLDSTDISIQEDGTIVVDSIISYVEYLKKQKGAMSNWDDISVTAISNGNTHTDKGFEFIYKGENYVYVYNQSGVNGTRYEPMYSYVFSGFGYTEVYTWNFTAQKMIVEIPEGVTYYNGGCWQQYICAIIHPSSLTKLYPGIFPGGYQTKNLKEIKINGTLTSIADSGILSEYDEFPQDCRIFYQGTEMTVEEFTDLF